MIQSVRPSFRKRTITTYLLIFLLGLVSCNQVLHLQIGEKCSGDGSPSPHIGGESSLSFYDELGNGSSLLERSGSSSIGGNVSASDSSFVCDPNIPLECVGGRCQCKKGYTLNRNGTKCLEVARNGLESSCEENIQCWKSLLGRMSECNLAIGKCQCYESESLPIVFHQGRCYYGESLGEFCQIEGLCEATTPNATCRSGGTCQCKEGFVPSWDKSRCLPIATDGLSSFCEENIQCEQSQMGALSECNQETMRCNCYKIPDMETVFHGGKCYFEAALGDVCQVSAQCQKKTSNSLCSKNGKCVCDDGYIPNGNNTLCLAIPSSDGILSSSTGNNNLGIPVWSGSGTEGFGGGSNINNNNNSNNNNSTPVGECQEDSQCFRKMGPYSRCNPKQKCECFIPETFPFRMYVPHNGNAINNNAHENAITTPTTSTGGGSSPSKPATAVSKSGFFKMDGISEPEQLELLDHLNPPSLVMVGSKCYLGKYLGQRCKYNKQCLVVTENSMCDGRCVCVDDTHVRSEDGRKCLQIAQRGLDSTCDEDEQCRRSELGPLSRCNGERRRCECANNVMPVVFFKGKCHFHRQLGSSCESSVECQAGSNYLAECSMGRCRCQNGTVKLSPHVCGFNAAVNRAEVESFPLSKWGIFMAVVVVHGTVLRWGTAF